MVNDSAECRTATHIVLNPDFLSLTYRGRRQALMVYSPSDELTISMYLHDVIFTSLSGLAHSDETIVKVASVWQRSSEI